MKQVNKIKVEKNFHIYTVEYLYIIVYTDIYLYLHKLRLLERQWDFAKRR